MESRSFFELLLIAAVGSGIGVFTGNYLLQKKNEKESNTGNSPSTPPSSAATPTT